MGKKKEHKTLSGKRLEGRSGREKEKNQNFHLRVEKIDLYMWTKEG